jgi:hypothetical protein
MIPEEEYKRRVKELIPKLSAKMTADSGETNELFQLYNDRFKPQESGKSCAGCRMRVFNRMKAYYDTIKDEQTL